MSSSGNQREYTENMMNKEAQVEKTIAEHSKQFGAPPETVSWAPGRIEVVGNHTDYNDGTVLSAAINLGHCFCISRTDHSEIRLFAVDVDQVASFEATDMQKVPG